MIFMRDDAPGSGVCKQGVLVTVAQVIQSRQSDRPRPLAFRRAKTSYSLPRQVSERRSGSLQIRERSRRCSFIRIIEENGMKKFAFIVALGALISRPRLADAQTVVIKRGGHHAGHHHHHGARAHYRSHRGWHRGHGHRNKVVIIKKRRY
jgi:hypothetical protein